MAFVVHVCVYATALLALATIFAYLFALYFSHSPRSPHSSELESVSINNTQTLRHILTFPQPDLELSVVVPCYNEETRLTNLLEAAVPYLKEHFPNQWEILIVDDGSHDKTVETAINFAKKADTDAIRCCSFVQNRGKGGAVTFGVNHARGKYILFADADNASDFTAVSSLIKAVEPNKLAVAVGSRAHLVNTEAVIKRSALRNTLMRGFHLLVYSFGVRTVKDTQCGFKLFTREAAQQVFPYMHTEGWIFDVEALLIAQRKNIEIKEIAISWHEVSGSKIDIARDSIKMAIDLVAMRFAFWFGIYNDSVVTNPPETAASTDSEPSSRVSTFNEKTLASSKSSPAPSAEPAVSSEPRKRVRRKV